MLIVGLLVALFLQGASGEKQQAFVGALKDSCKTILGVRVVLVFTISMVGLFINSGVNLADLPSMLMASATVGLLGQEGAILRCLLCIMC